MSTHFEYKTEVLTSLVGRDKLRMNDLEAQLTQRGAEGWELVSLNLDADLKGQKDGHLLVFKRAKLDRNVDIKAPAVEEDPRRPDA